MGISLSGNLGGGIPRALPLGTCSSFLFRGPSWISLAMYLRRASSLNAPSFTAPGLLRYASVRISPVTSETGLYTTGYVVIVS